MSAGSIDAELNLVTDFKALPIEAGSTNYAELEIINSGILGLTYQSTSQKTSGSDNLYQNLEAELIQDGVTQWTGFLQDLDFTSPELASTDLHQLRIEVSLPADSTSSLEELDCEFEINFLASQPDALGGWTDQETLPGQSLSSGDWTAPEVPENLGFNVASESETPNEGNPVASDLDLNCTTTGKVYTNENSVAHNWSDESDSDLGPVKYERLVTYPDGRTGVFGPLENNYTDFSSFGGGGGTEGTWGVQVRSYDDTANYSAWSDKCEIVYDKTSPTVAITNPADGDPLEGLVNIRGTVEDANPHHYYLVITDSNGNKIGPGTVNETASFADKVLYNWNTAEYPDGDYVIELAARDSAGNRYPTSGNIEVNVTVDNPLKITNVTSETPTTGTTKGTEGGENSVEVEITWDTDIAATSQVVIDDKSHAHIDDYFDSTVEDSSLVTSHSQIASGLAKDTTYYYRVISKDSATGTKIASKEYTFISTIGGEDDPAADPGEIVMNEFLPNPSKGSYPSENALPLKEGEWVELYNTTDSEIDLKNYYLEDDPDKGDHTIIIDNTRTKSGDTLIPANGYLVVYLKNTAGAGSVGAILNNEGDTLSFYNKDDQLLDDFTYDGGGSDVPEDKTFARLPDGHGPWIDPEPTPGDDNDLTKQEKADFQELAFEECFEFKQKLQNSDKDTFCNPAFLEIIDLLDDKDDDKIGSELFEELLEAADIEIEAKEEGKDANKKETGDENTEEPLIEEEENQEGSQSQDQGESNDDSEDQGTDADAEDIVEGKDNQDENPAPSESVEAEEIESTESQEPLEAQLEVKFKGDLETADNLAWEIEIDQKEFTVNYSADKQNDFQADFPDEELKIDLEDLNLEKIEEVTKLEISLETITNNIELPEYLEITEPDTAEIRVAKIQIFEVEIASTEGEKEKEGESAPDNMEDLEGLTDRKNFLHWLISQKSNYLS